MIGLNKLHLLTFFLLVALNLNGQDFWKPVKKDGDIIVYTRKLDPNGFKEIKIEAKVQASLNEIMAAFNDVEAHKEWVYKTPVSRFINHQENQTVNYYVQLDLPFPAQDRDLVINYKWIQDSDTKVITTTSFAVDGVEPEKENMVRVKEFFSNYVLTPLGDGQVQIVYTARMDPGGKLPNWLVNIGVTIGPTKSMKSLFELLKTGRYKGVLVAGVEELNKS